MTGLGGWVKLSSTSATEVPLLCLGRTSLRAHTHTHTGRLHKFESVSC